MAIPKAEYLEIMRRAYEHEIGIGIKPSIDPEDWRRNFYIVRKEHISLGFDPHFADLMCFLTAKGTIFVCKKTTELPS